MSKKMFLTKVGGAVNPFLANCVAYYNVNANSNDSTVNLHNGTDTSMSYASAGIVNNCASFNGTSSKIIIPQSNDFDFSDITADIPFTISFWFKPNSAMSTQWILSKRDGSVAQWQIVQIGGYVQIGLFGINTSNAINARINDTLVDGVGNYYTITYDGSGLSSGINIYTNGLVGFGTSTFTTGTYTKMPISNQPLLIGVDNFATVLWLNGALDEISIHKGVAYSQPMALDAYNKLLTGNSLI